VTASVSAPATADAALSRREITVIIICYLVFVVLGMPDGLFSVALPEIRREFGLGVDAVGILFVATTAGFLVSSFLVGRLLKRYDMATYLVAAGILRSVSLLGYVLLPAWWSVVLNVLVFGMASGAIDAGMNTWFAMRFGPRFMNWLHAAFGLGAMFGPIAAVALLDQGMTWRAGYGLMLVLQVIMVGVVFATRGLWHIPPHHTREAGPEPEGGHVTAWQTLLVPAVWLGIAVFFFYTGVELTAANWSFTLFTEGRGLDATAAGLATGAFWFCFTVGRIAFGFVRIRSLAVLLRTCLLVALAGDLLLAWAPAAWTGYIGLIVIGVGVAPVFPLLVSETPERLGNALAQHAIGFQVGAASLGIAVLPSLAGVVAARTTLEAIPLFLIGVNVVLLLLHEWMVRVRPGAPAHA
jgi:fucose permease